MNNALWLIALVLMTLTVMLCIQVKELQRQHMTLAIQMSELEDRLNYQMQLIDKLQQTKPEHSGFRAEAKPFMMPENGTIEYSHLIYRIPEGNK